MFVPTYDHVYVCVHVRACICTSTCIHNFICLLQFGGFVFPVEMLLSYFDEEFILGFCLFF